MDRSPTTLRSQLDVQGFRRPRVFRRRTWWLALWCAILPLAGLAYTMARGDRAAYTAGKISASHAFIENDCARCHGTWAPIERIAALGETSKIGNSVSNQACQNCHQAPKHYFTQTPSHESLSCGACHVEHRGGYLLLEVHDNTCLNCHKDLKLARKPWSTEGWEGHGVKPGSVHVASDKGTKKEQKPASGPGDDKPIFWKHVTSFNPVTPGRGHPEFSIHRLGATERDPADPLFDVDPDRINERPVFNLLASSGTIRTGKRQGQTFKFGDATALNFSHATHLFLKMTPDANGQLQGERDPDKREVPHTRQATEANCNACHVKDSHGQYMDPIIYEKHCQGCHAIKVDLGLLLHSPDIPSVKVVHDKPEVVRGYLLDRIVAYTGGAGPKAVTKAIERPVPGADEPPLAEFFDAATPLGTQLKQVEHALFGEEADGGCRYCHTVKQSPGAIPGTRDWTVVPPEIPIVWMPHSRFDHESHRFMACLQCHTQVAKVDGEGKDAKVTALSDSVSDINISKVAACYGCHAQSAAGRKQTSLTPKDTGPVPTRCIDCHVYHARKPTTVDTSPLPASPPPRRL